MNDRMNDRMNDCRAGAPVRILVVDDHTLFRRGLTALLSRDAGLQVVGDAGDAGEAQRRAAELQPDLILLDNHLPGVSGVDALPALRQAAPAARIVMLTVSEDEADLAAALRGGACGYLLKTIEGDALVSAIQRAMRGASNKEIARELGIAETTVKIHVQHVLRKLGFSSRVQAAVAATAHGLS